MEDFENTRDYEDSFRYRVYKSARLFAALKAISVIIAGLTAVSFIAFFLHFLLTDYKRALGFGIVTGVPFIAVTLLRRLINAKRPYELLPFYETPPKNKIGKSFPSRHVFSIFVIGCL